MASAGTSAGTSARIFFKKISGRRNIRRRAVFKVIGMTGSRRDAEDRERLVRWVREHGRAVRGFLSSLVRPGDAVDDLVQEVFRRAWQARENYRENGHARAYLLRIADRLAIDWRRAGARRAQLQLDDETWRQIEPVSAEVSPVQAMSAAEAGRQLAEAIESLAPQQQRVLLLRYYGELTFAEIAQQLDCPLSTALSHCRRGLASLRRRLSESVT